MDHEALRDFLNTGPGDMLLEYLGEHRIRADQEVLRLTRRKDYDPVEVRFRAGVSTGMELILDAIRELRKVK